MSSFPLCRAKDRLVLQNFFPPVESHESRNSGPPCTLKIEAFKRREKSQRADLARPGLPVFCEEGVQVARELRLSKRRLLPTVGLRCILLILSKEETQVANAALNLVQQPEASFIQFGLGGAGSITRWKKTAPKAVTYLDGELRLPLALNPFARFASYNRMDSLPPLWMLCLSMRPAGNRNLF